MIRRPPRSTLFPYTAIKDPLDVTANPFAMFSSVSFLNFVDAWTLGGFGGYFWNTVLITALVLVGTVVLSVLAGYALARLYLPGKNIIFLLFMLGLMIPFLDRKSTRLNSSHANISYAVFCLKKKK